MASRTEFLTVPAPMHAAASLKPSSTIRPLMHETLFGLHAATGMRISEALTLQIDDVTTDGLIIRQTKFQKSPIAAAPPHDMGRPGPVFGGPSPRRALKQRAVRLARRYTTVLPYGGRYLPLPGAIDRPARRPRPSGTPPFMICGTPSPCAPWSNAGTIAMPSAAISSLSALTSATRTSPTPTGICRRRRS